MRNEPGWVGWLVGVDIEEKQNWAWTRTPRSRSRLCFLTAAVTSRDRRLSLTAEGPPLTVAGIQMSHSFPLPSPPPSLLGSWPSSMKIFSLSRHMCRHQRPTTAWNSRGRFIEGDAGRCVPSFHQLWLTCLGFCSEQPSSGLLLAMAALFFFSQQSSNCAVARAIPLTPRSFFLKSGLHVKPPCSASLNCSAPVNVECYVLPHAAVEQSLY